MFNVGKLGAGFGRAGMGKTPKFSPLEIAGAEIWLDSSVGVETSSGVSATDGQTVEFWRDQSGNGMDFNQTLTASNRPIYQTVDADLPNSGLPYLDFDDTDFLEAQWTAFQSLSAFTVIMCVAPTADWAADTNTHQLWAYGRVNTTNGVFGAAASTGPLTGETTHFFFGSDAVNNGRLGSSEALGTANTFYVDQSDFSSSGSNRYYDNTALNLNLTAAMTSSTNTAPNQAATYSNDYFYISGFGSGASTGTSFGTAMVSEVLVYNSVLSSADRTTIFEYLKTKYGIV